ncbi:hypothetical protein AVEN_94919-1 [Araneus ventricosus]|uniref:Uncharacterized protein n=1 Tax=Araneus ventricosus TaxID=182803 RepID=A0A4Y2DKN4_ARAVE|nr:hypothetical protein AVEN_94919-1 [Araneus ventricosus]
MSPHPSASFRTSAAEGRLAPDKFTGHHVYGHSFKNQIPLRGTSSSGVTGFTTPRYPSDLISLQAFPSPSASTFRFSASFPRRQARELSMRSCRRSICFLLLMDSQKPHVLAVRSDPLEG